MLSIKIIGLDEAVERLNNISSNLRSSLINGIFEGGMHLEQQCEIERPEVDMITLRDEHLPGAIVVPRLPEDIYKAAMKEVGYPRAHYMRDRCPAELYFRTAFRKYIQPSPIYQRIVETNIGTIANIILEHVLRIFG